MSTLWPPSHVTRDDGRWSNAEADRVEVEPYDPAWPARYAEEAARLHASLVAEPAFGLGALALDGLALHHIGSTAVPGLAAKPVIDILLLLERVDAWPLLIEPLAGLGYVHWGDNPRPDRMFFVKGMPPFGTRRSHHLHVRMPADGLAELRFRDHLRRHARDAWHYAVLKQELATLHPTDRDAYTAGKAAFIAEMLARASH